MMAMDKANLARKYPRRSFGSTAKPPYDEASMEEDLPELVEAFTGHVLLNPLPARGE